MLPQANRLKTSRDFDTVYRRGSHFKGRFGKLICFERGDDGPARIGIVVSAKRGNAVTRNRVKRLIREAFRAYLPEMKNGMDVTYIVWEPEFSLADMSEEIMKLMKDAGCTK
jgi:ribonuclease P protein component